MARMVFAPQDNRVVDLEPSFPIPQHPEEALTLSQRVAYLLSNAHHLLPNATAILRSLHRDLPIEPI